MLNRVIDFVLQRATKIGSYHPSKDPPQWMFSNRFFARSGIDVTEDNAKQLAAFYAGITLYCSTFCALPLLVHKRRDDGGKDRAPAHWLCKLLHDRPNLFMTPAEFKEMIVGHLLLRGNFFAKKVFNNSGQLVQLWPLHPDRVTARWERLEPEKAAFGIVYTISGSKDAGGGRYLSDDILHIKGLHSDGVNGESVIAAGRETIGRGLAAGEHASDQLKNYAVPLGVLKYPEDLEDADYERIRSSWKQQHGGDNRYAPAILEGGMEWEQIGLSNEDAQFLQSRQFEVAEIARLLNLPLHKLKDLDRSVKSNVEQQQIEFKQDSILPIAVRIEEGIGLGLLGDAEREDYFVEFLLDGMLRGDTSTRFEAYHLAISDGWMSRNEARMLENLNPDPKLDGFLEPLNMVPAGTPRDNKDPMAPAKDDSADEDDTPSRSVSIAHLEPVFKDALTRVLTKEQKQLQYIAGKPEPAKRLQDFYEKHADFLIEVLRPAVKAAGMITLKDPVDLGMGTLVEWANRRVEQQRAGVLECLQRQDYAAALRGYAASLQPDVELFELMKGDICLKR